MISKRSGLDLIGLTGPARSGKDIVALHLSAHYGFCRMAFADPIRSMIRAMIGDKFFDWMMEDKEAERTELFGASCRFLMQTLGTEWGRLAVHPDLWVRLAELKMEAGNKYVISDVRFENEADFVRDRGGVIVHLSRPGVPPVRPHSSERGVIRNDEDVEFVNDGDIRQLLLKVNSFCDKLSV